jgi:Mycobacterium membrane protein
MPQILPLTPRQAQAGPTQKPEEPKVRHTSGKIEAKLHHETLPKFHATWDTLSFSGQIGCWIMVNEVLKDERSASGVNAQTFCIVKTESV